MATKKDHSSLTEAEQNYIQTKKAYNEGNATTAQLNAAIDAVLHPNYPSRAAGYENITSGKNSMPGQMLNDARNSPVVSDIAKGVDMLTGSNLSSKLANGGSSIGNGASVRSGSGRGSGSGYSGASGSAFGANSGYGSYLDMLHAEQERVWQREDTAYQRTVRDLQAAGLNPVLAVGGSIHPAGGSSSSDSQVVGAVADLAAMAIDGLTETAEGVSRLAALNHEASAGNTSFLTKFGSWYKQNAGTIKNVVGTASSLARLLK